MAVLSQVILSASTAAQAEAAGVQQLPQHSAPPPVAGNDSSAESGSSETRINDSSPAPDVVKVQMEPPGEIIVYRFVNQQGNLVLQVPPQQLLDLAQQIYKELAPRQAATDSEGGNPHGS